MKKILPLYLFIIVGTITVNGLTGSLLAQAPPIRIDLNFLKPYFSHGEAVGATIRLYNTSTRTIWINKGFRTKDFFMEMRVIDPAGRLLIPRGPDRHDEFPDAPPLPYVQHEGKLIRVAPCENLSPGFSHERRENDLRKYYAMDLPGNYSFQTQLSTMIFKDGICDSRDYEWLGMLKSETKYIYTEGKTKIVVDPNKWKLKWQNPQIQRSARLPKPAEPEVVKVTIYPEAGRTVEDYRRESIRLNNVAPIKQPDKSKDFLTAFFSPKDCIDSLGKDVKPNRSYPVVISGKMKSGLSFGGGQKILVEDKE